MWGTLAEEAVVGIGEVTEIKDNKDKASATHKHASGGENTG